MVLIIIKAARLKTKSTFRKSVHVRDVFRKSYLRRGQACRRFRTARLSVECTTEARMAIRWDFQMACYCITINTGFGA